MKKDKKRSFEWLRWTAVVVLLLVSVVLIFNQQIKSYLVGSYKPEITRQTVQSNQKKKRPMIFKVSKILTCKRLPRLVQISNRLIPLGQLRFRLLI